MDVVVDVAMAGTSDRRWAAGCRGGKGIRTRWTKQEEERKEGGDGAVRLGLGLGFGIGFGHVVFYFSPFALFCPPA